MTRILQQQISVSWDFPVVFTRGLFTPENDVLTSTLHRPEENRRHRVAVFIDRGVAEAHPLVQREISEYLGRHAEKFELVMEPLLVPGGELAKNSLQFIQELMLDLLRHRMDRHSYVLAVGGGAVLDAVGLAAALVHRGLRMVRAPTTVLSQCDGAVGVKNGINFAGTKNAIGTFAPPFAVLGDLDFLQTLPHREWLDGVAEAFKVAIIRDAEFFSWLCKHAGELAARSTAAMEETVIRCAELHLQHIRGGGDPFEYGSARPLDFGHWSAHKLETLSGFRISHGEAVAAGVLLDSWYAREQGWISGEEFASIHGALRECGFPLWYPELQQQSGGELDLLEGLREFQEHLGGRLCVTFPAGIGSRFEVNDINPALMRRGIEAIKEFAARHAAAIQS